MLKVLVEPIPLNSLICSLFKEVADRLLLDGAIGTGGGGGHRIPCRGHMSSAVRQTWAPYRAEGRHQASISELWCP